MLHICPIFRALNTLVLILLSFYKLMLKNVEDTQGG
jgi:hypothetical protein